MQSRLGLRPGSKSRGRTTRRRLSPSRLLALRRRRSSPSTGDPHIASALELARLDEAVRGRRCLFKSRPAIKKALEAGPFLHRALDLQPQTFAQFLPGRFPLELSPRDL